MAGDLERFLQQAAERLAEKVRQGQGEAPRPNPQRQPPKNVRMAERAPVERLEPEVVDAAVLEAPAERGTNPLSQLDTRHLETRERPSLAQEISLADEKMASHVQHVTGGDVMHIRAASAALQGFRDEQGRTRVKNRERQVSPLVEMLRKPESLRAAFIASQIFERRHF